MTHDEMRRRLAEVMGWHSIRTSVSNAYDADGYQYQSCKMWGAAPGARPESNMHVPNPLESDRDAARLRAWCARRGWRITCCHDEGAAWWRVSDLRLRGLRGEATVDAKEEPDYCRRERLAFCRAVLAVLEDAES